MVHSRFLWNIRAPQQISVQCLNTSLWNVDASPSSSGHFFWAAKLWPHDLHFVKQRCVLLVRSLLGLCATIDAFRHFKQ